MLNMFNLRNIQIETFRNLWGIKVCDLGVRPELVIQTKTLVAWTEGL